MAAVDYAAVVQQLYVSYFGRPADFYGLQNFEKALSDLNAPTTFKDLSAAAQSGTNPALSALVNSFNSSPESIALYGTVTSDLGISKFVNAIYNNVLSRDADTSGLAFWVDAIKTGTLTLANAAAAITQAALENTSAQGLVDGVTVQNKLAVASDFTSSLDSTAKINAFAGDVAAAEARALLHDVNSTTDVAAFHAQVVALEDKMVSDAVGAFTLTNGTDHASAAVFNAGLVYNPAGTDRINSLQSEDVLTGLSHTSDNVLNATLGNANDNGAQSVTPTLINIQTINLDVTGNTKTVDVRFADSLKTLSINKITAEAANTVTIQNIGQPAANLTVKDSAQVDNTVNFNYVNGVLKGTTAANTAETGNLTLSNASMGTLHIGNAAATEGFETLNLTSNGTTIVKNLEAADLENLIVQGDGNLTLVNTTQQTDRVKYEANGIDIGDGLGMRKIDLAGFTGTASVDITAALGGHADPANSGAQYYSSTIGSAGDDTLWTNAALAAKSATLKDTIDGGAGVDTLKMIDAGITRTGTVVASVTNVEKLDLRLQGGAAQSVSLAAFDANLAAVTLRNEQKTGNQAAAAGTFDLHDTTAAIAGSATGITLLHASGTGATGAGTATAVVDTVKVHLADATGTADTVVLNVQSDLNTSSTYDYTVNLETEKDAAGAYKGFVENLTINDKDTESNTVVIESGNDKDGATVAATGLTGNITLTGGSADKAYVVNSTLVATTVDASTQLSDLTLTVGKADQTIKLGSGSDTLTFDGLDTFNGSDKLSDAGGTDTVRAAFSKDVTGTPELTGIEKLHIVANANTAIDLSKGQAISELAILSDKAVDGANEIFSTPVTGVGVTDIITLKNTKLDTINFFGDADGTNADGLGDTNTTKDSGAYTQTFNGVTLENNTGDTVAVKIAAPLANGTDSQSAGDGIKAYNLGQLTTHGVKSLNIAVANEYMEDGVNVDPSVKTTIANIWDRDLVNLTLSAKGSIDLGTVTGNTVNSNIKVFDASAVGGDVTAIVKALGDSAVVTLAAGDDSFNALGSAGNNVVIHGGDGKNVITGTAQSDYIDTGAGNDTIDANRGNNTIKSGAGNDTVSALNGSNTVDVGSGFQDAVTLKYDTDAQRDLATNVIAGSGTSATVTFDSASDNTFGFAVGDGAELSVKFTGITFDTVASTLNGRSAIIEAANAFTGQEANLSNLLVAVDSGITNDNFAATITGGSAADVFLDYRTNAAALTDAYDVSLGAGNDAIVIAQNSTGAHTITGGTGVDRIVLSAGVGVDTLVYAEGDSTIAGRDLVTNFQTGSDKIDVSTVGAAGSNAGLSSSAFSATVNVVVDGAGYVTLSAGTIDASNVDAVLNFLAAKANVANEVFFVSYDSNGDGAMTAADNTVMLQNVSNKLAIEFVGAAPAITDLV